MYYRRGMYQRNMKERESDGRVKEDFSTSMTFDLDF